MDRDGLLRVLKDGSRPDAERRAAAEALAELDPRALAALRQGASRGEAPVPAIHPRLAGDELTLAALLSPPEIMERLLRAGGGPEEAVLGARLAAAARADAAFARGLEPLVRALLADTRPAGPADARTVGEAVEACYVLVAQGGGKGAPDWRAGRLTEAVESLVRLGQVPGAGLALALQAALPGGPAEVLRLARGRLLDAALPGAARLAARGLGDRVISQLNSPDLAPAARESALPEAERLDETSLAVLRSPGAAPGLKQALFGLARRRLAAGAEELQAAGHLVCEPLPKWRDVKDRKDPGAVSAFSARLRLAEVESFLAAGPEADPERVYAAVRFAPVIAGWCPPAAERFGPPLAALAARAERVSWETPGKKVSVDLGAEAWRMFADLLWTLDPDAPVPSWLPAAAVTAVRGALERGHSFADRADLVRKQGRAPVTRALRELFGELSAGAGEELKARLAAAMAGLGLKPG